MMTFSKKKWGLGLLFFLMPWVCVGAQWGGAGMKKPPTPVVAALPHWVQHHPPLHAVGSLVANQFTTIKPGVAGHVQRLLFDSGQTVFKGQLLVVLDHAVLSAQLKAARAQATLNHLAYQRAAELLNTRSISQSEFDQAKAQFDMSQAKVGEIAATLEKKFIRAPFSGRLGLRHIHLGDYVLPDQAIVYIQSSRPIYVDFSLPEKDKQSVWIKQPLSITFSGQGGAQAHSGHVVAIDAQIDRQTRSITVRGAMPNAEGYGLPGGFVEVHLSARRSQSLLSIPQEAVQKSQKQNYVFFIKKGRAAKATVHLVERRSDDVLIKKPPQLSLKTPVIVQGQLKIAEGMPVVAINLKKTPNKPVTATPVPPGR